MINKTVEDIRTEMMAELLARLPNLDLTEGTPERDLFIEAPIAGQLLPLWEKLIYAAKLHAPIVYADDLETADIEDYVANFNVTPQAATRSTGTVTFYANSEPTRDITIVSGATVASDSDSPVEFEVQGTYTLYASIASSYYNAVTSRWEIDCAVRAKIAGPEYRAGSGTVTKIIGGITGINGVTNASAITGGAAAETVANTLRRVVEKFQGRGLASTQGIKTYVSSYASYVNVVGANDPEMLRDEGLGGALDIYIVGETLENATDTISITSTGLSYPLTVTYTNKSVVLAYQPVDRIISVTKNDVILPSSYYILTKDTGLLAKSPSSYDAVTLTSAGLIATGYFVNEDEIEINYIYNSLPTTIQNDLNDTGNHYMNRDYLVREMTDVTINVYMKFKEEAGQDFDSVADTVELDIATFIDSIGTGGSVELADIIGVAKAISAVDNIDLTTVALTNTGGGTLTNQGDCLLGKNEIAVSGTITLERWTN